MSHMFYRCSSLNNLDLTSFHTPNVTEMSYMFDGCIALKNVTINDEKLKEQYEKREIK